MGLGGAGVGVWEGGDEAGGGGGEPGEDAPCLRFFGFLRGGEGEAVAAGGILKMGGRGVVGPVGVLEVSSRTLEEAAAGAAVGGGKGGLGRKTAVRPTERR